MIDIVDHPGAINIVDLAVSTRVPRDQWDRPLVVPRGGGKPVGHTRTTTFIDCVEDKSNLIDWGKRSVLLGAARKPSLLAGVAELDPADSGDKRTLNRLAEAATDAAGSNEKREKGTYLHALSELVDAGEQLPSHISDADLEDMTAYKMETIMFDVVHTERLVVVNELGTAGTPDRVARYTGPGPIEGLWFEDELFITDLKTGTVAFGALKMATQLAVYSRGEFYDHTVFPVDVEDKAAFKAWKATVFPAELAETAYQSIGAVNQQWGVIVNLPAGSGACTLYWVDLTVGWRTALLAKMIRTTRSAGSKAMLPWTPVKKKSKAV